MKKCDIIIPIYNAYNCLQPCIESVLKNTDMKNNRLILINDKSTDNKVLPLLKKYTDNKNVILLENEENLGFVGTVNKGMKFSNENDCLLLNSDTEVTKNWLKKIQKCAYSKEDIATVTPLSNNATLASIPKSFVPNEIPDNLSLNEFAEVVEKASYNDYPEIPTGHGFCLFIKREALNLVGFFDEKSFGKGYGEENDFCFRCLDVGLKHVICDNAYVYHKESQSFSKEKDAEIKQGLELLDKRYPIYKHNLDVWVQEKKLDYLGNNVVLELGKKSFDKSNILFVIHDWKDVPNSLGGTTLHVWDIIRKLRKYFNFHVLASEDGIYKVYSYWSNTSEASWVQFHSIPNFSIGNFYNRKYEEMFKNIIEMYNINLVHIHHLIGHYFDVIDVCKKMDIKVLLTLHDYYFVCPTINKIYLDQEYCDEGSCDKCNNCLKSKYSSNERAGNFIKRWRNVCESELKKCDLLITPSEAAKNEILKTFKDLKIQVVEHGIDLPKTKKNTNLDKKSLDIAFLGAIGYHKGSKILSELTRIIKFSNIRMHLFGISDIPIKSNKYFNNHGKYKREELNDLISKNSIDLICLFSIWPETYSYTLTEAIACGVPVLTFDFGAIAERVKNYNLGYVIPVTNDVKKIKNELIRIEKNQEEYKEKLKSIDRYKIRTTKEMDEEYKRIYEKNLKNKSSNIKYDEIKQLIKESSIPFGNVTIQNYAWILNTLKWKIISKLKIPQFIKRIHRKLLGK